MCFLANPITACAAHHDVMVVAFTRFLPAAEHTRETLIETTSPQHEAEAFLTSFATETILGSCFQCPVNRRPHSGRPRATDNRTTPPTCVDDDVPLRGETIHGPWLPFYPLDDCPRNLVFHDHDARDAIFSQERSGTKSGRLDAGIRSPRRRKIGRGAPPHRGDESEQDVDGQASTVVPSGGPESPAPGTRSTSPDWGNGGSS